MAAPFKKTSVSIEGLSELEDALKELPKATGRNVIKRALTQAAEPIRAAAASYAPTGRTGVLKQSIAVSKIRFSKGEAGKAAFAAAMKRGASRAEAQAAAREANAEAGNDEDITSGLAEIGPAKKSEKIDPWYAHFVEFGTVKMSAKPFMRPAYESQKMSAVESVKDILKAEIQKAVDRIARKNARLIAQAKSSK